MVNLRDRLEGTSPGGADCSVCGAPGMEVFFEMPDVPVLCNAPCSRRETALDFPKGDITLAFCGHCGFIDNRTFVSKTTVYDESYENSLHFSARFQGYIRELASHLINRFHLHNKDIIEIGCGKGDFLALLCDLGDNRGIGFDPTYEADRLKEESTSRLRIVRDFYSESYGDLACDLLCCRHTLEHIPDPVGFLTTIRRAMGTKLNTAVFFEVPNALYTLRCRGIWDIIYEHCLYFWWVPLSRLFTRCGFRVSDIREAYDGQFLCIESIPSSNPDSALCGDHAREIDQVCGEIRAFSDIFSSTVERARGSLDRVKASKRRAVVWGAGSKGVTFLNLFKGCEALEYVVDINPHKQGMYVPGTGQRIVSPGFLREYQPDAVFVMNPIYQNEIRKTLSDMCLSAEVLVA